MRPIGQVFGGRDQPDDDSWDAVEAKIALDGSRFGAEALAGLSDFSHLEVVFHFDRVPENEITSTARHPRDATTGPRSASSPNAAKAGPTGLASASADYCP